jgi:hypothetical protein
MQSMEMKLLKNLFCMTGVTNLKTVSHKKISTAVAQQHEGTMKIGHSSHKCDIGRALIQNAQQDLSMQHVYVKFVPHILMEDHIISRR